MDNSDEIAHRRQVERHQEQTRAALQRTRRAFDQFIRRPHTI
jgi:hypothetical protein